MDEKPRTYRNKAHKDSLKNAQPQAQREEDARSNSTGNASISAETFFHRRFYAAIRPEAIPKAAASGIRQCEKFTNSLCFCMTTM